MENLMLKKMTQIDKSFDIEKFMEKFEEMDDNNKIKEPELVDILLSFSDF